MITAERLRELLIYNPETGVFTHRVNRRGGLAGDVAGARASKGYISISVKNREYKAHRLAWLYVTGAWPRNQIDHINGIKDDNRFANLREATNAENKRNGSRQRNNTTGFKGVVWRRTGWKAQIYKDGRQIYLGTFATADEARAAYAAAALEHHGEFARVE